MSNFLKKTILLAFVFILPISVMADSLQCKNKDFTLQILGSGGPITDDQRASSGEIIWINNKSAILIDTGGGVFLRFGQSGARLEDLKLISLTHFHTDHASDLAAILKGGYFLNKIEKIDIVGPKAGGNFPSMSEYFYYLFKKEGGAYSYLNGLYDATDGINISTNIKDIDYKANVPQLVYRDKDIYVTALGIPHGNVPCLAYRIETDKGIIVISADQNGSNNDFISFAKDADILVMPLAIDENADKQSKFMHAAPSIVGKLANKINPKILVINHLMGKSIAHKNESINIIKQFYHGNIYSSRDLSCFPISLTTIQE